MQRPISIAGALLLCALPAPAEFQISPGDGANHSYPSICRQPGGFVVAWESSGPDGREIVVQRLDDSGQPSGSSTVANQTTTGDQQLPDIACRSDGSFLVVWESRGQDGDALGVYGRNFGSAGTPSGAEFQVNTYTTDNQRHPRVCVAGDGDAVITWESFAEDGDGGGIYARHVGESSRLGSVVRANFVTSGNQTTPSVACAADGTFLIAWQNRLDNGTEIVATLFDDTGSPINESTFEPGEDLDRLLHPEVAALADGAFAIAYESRGGINLANLRIGPEISASRGVQIPRTGRNEAPTVTTDGQTIFAAWSRGAGFDFGIEGMRIDPELSDPRGTTINNERGTNDGALSTLGRGIDIATTSNGDIVAWQKRNVFADDSTSAIFVQRFLDCIGDCSADGVVRVNELITAVRIALDQAAADTCASIDANGNGSVEINELVRAVNEALASICPAPAG